MLSVNDKDDLVCITSQGNTLKLRLAEVATLGKTAMGVRIVNITKPDVVVGVARVVKEEQNAKGRGRTGGGELMTSGARGHGELQACAQS